MTIHFPSTHCVSWFESKPRMFCFHNAV